eukprot:4668156-Alexandrium_andersonii.AAC.1
MRTTTQGRGTGPRHQPTLVMKRNNSSLQFGRPGAAARTKSPQIHRWEALQIGDRRHDDKAQWCNPWLRQAVA